MAFRPAARDIGEDRQNRDFVIVVPKKKRIVPEQNEAEDETSDAGATRRRLQHRRQFRSNCDQ